VGVVRCPYCGYESKFKLLKTWKLRFYGIKRLLCPNVMVSLITTMVLALEEVMFLNSLLRDKFSLGGGFE
jgi:hypothetical protein